VFNRLTNVCGVNSGLYKAVYKMLIEKISKMILLKSIILPNGMLGTASYRFAFSASKNEVPVPFGQNIQGIFTGCLLSQRNYDSFVGEIGLSRVVVLLWFVFYSVVCCVCVLSGFMPRASA
jgi:hypothetical protein